MSKPKGRGGGRPRRPARGKGAARARRPQPKAKGAKPAAARKAKPVAAKKKKVVAPAKPARRARKPKTAVARPEAAAPRPTPPVDRKEEGMTTKADLTPDQFLASLLSPEYSKASGHICWECKHFKPVQKGSKFPPADTIGWCTKIHWPFYWCVTDFNVVKKCYTLEKGVYSVKKF